MKNSKNLLLGLLVVLLIISMVACGGSGRGTVDKGGQTGKKSDKNMPNKLEDPNIKIFFHAATGGKDAILMEPIRMFEEKYGGKVTLMKHSDLDKQLIAAITAGDAPDVTYTGQGNMPKFAIQNVLQPVDDYIDINDPVWNINMMNQFKYNGKHYVITKDVMGFFIYYNKSLFENNGLKTPMEYYKEGNWNWENFEKSAIALTQDTNKDGVIDQWGYTAQNKELFMVSNKGDFVLFKDDGGIELTANDSKTVQALQFAQDGMNKYKYFSPLSKTFSEDFRAGKVAMVAERSNTMGDDLKATMKYEWDIAPFPVGPQGEKGLTPASTGNWAIPIGAKNPNGGATWIYIFNKNTSENDLLPQNFNEEQIKLIEELEKKAVIPRFKGVGNMTQKINQKLWKDIGKGTPVQTAIDQVSPELQGEIDALLGTK